MKKLAGRDFEDLLQVIYKLTNSNIYLTIDAVRYSSFWRSAPLSAQRTCNGPAFRIGNLARLGEAPYAYQNDT